MSDELEQVVSFEVDENGILVYSTKGVWGYYTKTLFLCEVFEKLNDHFSNGIPCNEFFNYEDPHGAWVLLSDFFQKTNYLQNVTLKDFEEYRSRYNIALDYKKGERSTIYEQNAYSPESVIALKRFACELDRWRIFDKESVDNALFNPDIFRYYSCRNMIDFVFALVHYCVYNDYKITKCAHCGKLFITKKGKKNGEEKYCCRNSPFAGYEEYPCKKAVKAIKDMLDKKRISEYERLRNRAKEYSSFSNHTALYNAFCSTCDEYKEKLKKGASVALLEEYKAFLFDSQGVRPKYERIKNW